MKAHCLLLALMLALAGCAPTLTEIRSSNPDNIIESPRSPQSLANCIYYEAQTEADKFNSFWNRIDMTEQESIYRLSLISTGGLFVTQTIPTAEVTIKPNGKGGSIVEIRSHNAPVRTGPRHVLEYVEKCAQQKIPEK